MKIVEDLKNELENNEDHKQFGRMLRGISLSMLCIMAGSIFVLGLLFALKITSNFFEAELFYGDYLTLIEGIWIGMLLSYFITATLVHIAKKRNPIFWIEHSQE